MSGRQRGLRLIILIACFLGILGSGCINMVKSRQYFLENQTRLVGTAYRENPELCREILYQMFEGDPQKQQIAGEEALISFGYTRDGLDYWYKDRKVSGFQTGIFAAQSICILILGGVFYELLCWRKKEAQYQYENVSLKAELDAKENYLQKREQQVQQFAENIAHQLKTPLSCVFTSLDLLLYELEEEKKEKVFECFSYLNKMESLMKKLMKIGRLEAGEILMKKDAFFIKDLLEDCQNSLGLQENCFCLHTELLTEEAYYGDYEWLKEAFMNVLKNAAEHSPKGQTVEVNVSQTKEGLCMTVRDHGNGIDVEDLPYIFDRFYRPKQEKISHVGIGLNLAKLVVEKHFGSIKAENHPEGGAVFTIVLPCYSLKKEKI